MGIKLCLHVLVGVIICNYRRKKTEYHEITRFTRHYANFSPWYDHCINGLEAFLKLHTWTAIECLLIRLALI